MTESINLPNVEFVYTPVANYAIQQNRIPIVRKLIIENPSDEDLFDLSHKRLRTYFTDTELKSGLTKLYRASRLSVEENGANTLYLALGFLKWYETPKSELARYAPILLLPIEIIRKSAQKGYVIRSREKDTLMNITLLEMLKQDFEITINGLEELPRDESGVDVILLATGTRTRELQYISDFRRRFDKRNCQTLWLCPFRGECRTGNENGN